MTSRLLVALPACALTLALFNGCVAPTGPSAAGESSPSAASTAASGSDASSAQMAAEESGAADAQAPATELAPEVEQLVHRLTNPGNERTLQHTLADTTGFPSAMSSLAPGAAAPQVVAPVLDFSQPPPRGLTADGNSTELVERDWTGLVLVPLHTDFSKAHTTKIRLLKAEAHPMTDGRVRVWLRLQNLQDRELPAEVACAFQILGGTGSAAPYFYTVQVPAGRHRDVFFVSPLGDLASYTVLVRSSRPRWGR